MCYDRMNKAAADKCRFFFLRLCTKILYVLCHVYGMHMCLCVRVCWGVSERAQTSVINFSIYVILSLSSAITKSKGSRAIMCCHYKNFSTNTFAPTHRQVRPFGCKIERHSRQNKTPNEKYSINIVNGDSLVGARQSCVSNMSI